MASSPPSAAGAVESPIATFVGSSGTKRAALAAAATRVRRSRMALAPPPLGCTRLVRRIRYERVGGSIQTEVPVKPRCPTDSGGKYGDAVREKALDTSQPSARLPLPSGERSSIVAIVVDLNTRLPSSVPAPTSMRQIRAMSDAVENMPA